MSNVISDITAGILIDGLQLQNTINMAAIVE